MILICCALLAATANSSGFSSPLVIKSERSASLVSEVVTLDSANFASMRPNAESTSLDIFMAIIAMKTKYIKFIIFCLADTFPPAIIISFFGYLYNSSVKLIICYSLQKAYHHTLRLEKISLKTMIPFALST